MHSVRCLTWSVDFICELIMKAKHGKYLLCNKYFPNYSSLWNHRKVATPISLCVKFCFLYNLPSWHQMLYILKITFHHYVYIMGGRQQNVEHFIRRMNFIKNTRFHLYFMIDSYFIHNHKSYIIIYSPCWEMNIVVESCTLEYF